MKKPITILGFMGSGKSTIGRQLASKLGMQYLDLDDYIQETQGRTISEIFREKGESGFRDIESECLRKVLGEKDIVIALGGGAPCFNKNIRAIKDLSTSIYLKISPEELAYRLCRSGTPRPLIEGKSEDELREYIRIELKKREEFYLQADHIVESNRIQAEDILRLFFS